MTGNVVAYPKDDASGSSRWSCEAKRSEADDRHRQTGKRVSKQAGKQAGKKAGKPAAAAAAASERASEQAACGCREGGAVGTP